MLADAGMRGTYYASFGLMGTTAPTGPIFVQGDLSLLQSQEHELGCHTFDHCHAWDTPSDVFEASVERNDAARRRMVPDLPFRTLAYPISPPRPAIKRRAAARFSACRGGGQRSNVGMIDLSNLSAFFLEKSGTDCGPVEALIERTCHDGGWLILATHDVTAEPTAYGCTPWFFKEIVRAVASSGARVLPVGEALAFLQAS